MDPCEGSRKGRLFLRWKQRSSNVFVRFLKETRVRKKRGFEDAELEPPFTRHEKGLMGDALA